MHEDPMTYDRVIIESPAVDELVKVLGSCSRGDMQCDMARMLTVTSGETHLHLLAYNPQDSCFLQRHQGVSATFPCARHAPSSLQQDAWQLTEVVHARHLHGGVIFACVAHSCQRHKQQHT